MSTFPRTHRARGHELMDEECTDPSLLEAELSVLRRLNRLTSASRSLVEAIDERIAPQAGHEISLIDFGCGGADIVRGAVGDAAMRGWRLRVVATDAAASCVRHCESLPPIKGIRYAVDDLLGTDGADGQKRFDVAHASLVLHHFADEDVVRALRRMGAAATRLVVWNDLVRDRLGVVGAFCVSLGSAQPVRHDAVQSVRRGFTLDEARSFAEAAGLTSIRIRRWRGARFVLTGCPGPAEPAAKRPLVRAEGVSFRYGERRVVTNWTTLVRSGQVSLLEGPNGSGKSTRIRLLAGVLEPEAGRVWCDRVVGPVGYLPQHGGLMSSLDLGANMAMLQAVAGVPMAERAARARTAIEQFRLAEVVSRPIARLSVGQARRAAVASVFATAGMVLLLDEPDAGLDVASRALLGDLIAVRASEGCSIVVASHEPTWLERPCRASAIDLLRESGL